ncbi:MAG: hypothetical protein ACKVXR_02850 [Planctomycetota bacterium]
MKSALLVPVLLPLGGCTAVRLPPHEAPSRFGVVRAADPGTAREYARLLDDVGPFVAGALPGLEIEPVDLRIVGGVSGRYHPSAHPEFAGAVFESGSAKWVEMRSDLEPGSRRGVLAHELVHHWLGPAWSALPPALEDGLADVIGDAVREDDTPRERMMAFIACWITLNGELTVDRNATVVGRRDGPFSVTFKAEVERLAPAEILDVMGRDLEGYHSIDPRHFAVVTVLSRRLLSRISVDELFEICRAAGEEGETRIPPARVFAAAGIDPLDLRDWNELLLATYDLEERRALREEVQVPWKPPHSGGTDALEFSIHLQATVEF